MRVSNKCVELVKEFEGLYLHAYQDSVDVWTIGYGITNADKAVTKRTIKKGMTINGLKEGILKANMKLDQVCATTNETRTDIKSLSYNLSEIDKRLCVVENEVKDLKKKVGEKDD